MSEVEINQKSQSWTVQEIVAGIPGTEKKGHYNQIYLDLSFQRQAFWGIERKNKFILNVLKNHGIQNLTVCNAQECLAQQTVLPADSLDYYQSVLEKESLDGEAFMTMISVDGNNRVKTLYEFFTNQFKLDGVLWSDGGKMDYTGEKSTYYKDLPSDLQTRFLMTKIPAIVYSCCTKEQLHEIYRDINSGGALNRAEIRNAYISPVCDSIRQLGFDTSHIINPDEGEKMWTRYLWHERLACLYNLYFAQQSLFTQGKRANHADALDYLYTAHPLASEKSKLDTVLGGLVNGAILAGLAGFADKDGKKQSVSSADMADFALLVYNLHDNYKLDVRNPTALHRVHQQLEQKRRNRYKLGETDRENWNNATDSEKRKKVMSDGTPLKSPKGHDWVEAKRDAYTQLAIKFRNKVIQTDIEENYEEWIAQGVITRQRTRFSLETKRRFFDEGRHAWNVTWEDVTHGNTDMDHKQRLVDGGSNEEDNLWLVLSTDNRKRGSQDWDDYFIAQYGEEYLEATREESGDNPFEIE
jgi:hypothetical protein